MKLSLVELRLHHGKNSGKQCRILQGEDVQGGYRIICDDALMSLVGDFPAAFTVGLQGADEASAAFEYNTWLVTIW